MKERKRRQSLGGAVLIMVLTVMFVLIILLMATLTTVSTANQRIYTKYEENQAYYTARSALDVFTQNMLADSNYYAYNYTPASNSQGTKRQYIYGDGKTADMKQGLALQLDLYSITAQEGHNVLQDELRTYANTVSADTSIPSADKKDEYKNYFGVAALDPTSSSAVTAIYYEVELPKTANGSSQYGKLSDLNGGVSKAKIKVEVLNRTYDMGSKTITVGGATVELKDYIVTLNETTTPKLSDFVANATNQKDIAEAVVKGNRKKDTMRVKITATAEFDGVEGTAVLIYDSNEPPANNSSRAITAFGGTGSDNMSILGGMSAENTINWGSNDGYIYGPVYVEDDFLMTSNGPKIHLNSGDSLVVGGDMQLANSGHFVVTNDTTPLIVDDKNAPFVYVGGELRIVSDIEKPFMNMDVIAETVTANAKVTFDSSNTIYCKNFTSHCGSNSAYNGDIYVNGDVTIFSDNDTKVTYDGDGNPIVVHGGTGTIHFTGKILDGSKTPPADVTSGAGTGFAKMTTDLTFWNDIPEVSKITDPNPDVTAEGDKGEKIEFQLPGRSQKKYIETHVQSFDDYYVKKADGTREIDPATSRPVVKSAQTMADINTMGDKTKPFTAADTGITDKLTTLAPSGGNDSGTTFTHILDTGGGDVKCIWNETSNSKIRIKGGGTVVLQLDETASWGYSNDCMILVDDDTTLKIVGDVDSIGSGPWSNTFAKLEVYNQTTYGAYKNLDAGKGIDKLKVGNLSGKGIKVPKIYYYFTGSQFSVQTNCLLTGYVYAPDTKIDMHAASTPSIDPPHGKGMQYNGGAVTGTPVCIVGSALVKGASLPNNTGVAYINPDLDDDTPGEPIHSWQSYQYIRG